MTLKEKLQLAEQRLGGLPGLAGLEGREICPRPGTCCSPLREEDDPSWSWWRGNDGRDRWKDHGTGEGGDCVDFLAKSRGITNKEAVVLFLEMAGLSDKDSGPLPAPKPILPKPILPAQLKEKPKLPADAHHGTDEELAELIRGRGWDAPAPDLRELSDLGFLRFGTWQGESAWFLADPAGRFFEARRMDRTPWTHGAKSDTRGTKSLLGAERVSPGSLALLVEGAPDFLACALLIAEGKRRGVVCFDEAVPVAMFGGSSFIKAEDLERFKGVRVVIIPHLDTQGRKARDTWKAQLRKAGASVADINLSRYVHPGGKDLADTFDPFYSEGLPYSIQGRDEKLRDPNP